MYKDWENIQALFGAGGLLDLVTPPDPGFRLTQTTILSPSQSEIDKHLRLISV